MGLLIAYSVPICHTNKFGSQGSHDNLALWKKPNYGNSVLNIFALWTIEHAHKKDFQTWVSAHVYQEKKNKCL